MAIVCEPCIEALEEAGAITYLQRIEALIDNIRIEALKEAGAPEGVVIDMAIEALEEAAVEMGADIPDHLCAQLESGGDVPCACACSQMFFPPRKRGAGWSGKAKDFTPNVVAEVYRQIHD